MRILSIQVNDFECIEWAINKGIWIKLALTKMAFMLFKLGKNKQQHCGCLKSVVLLFMIIISLYYTLYYYPVENEY